MLTIKKRPPLSKPRLPSPGSDSDGESGGTNGTLSKKLRIPWRKEESNIVSGGFFVLDNMESNKESFSQDASTDAENIMKVSTIEKKPDVVIVDESVRKLLDKVVCGPSFEKTYAGTAKLIGNRAAKRLRKLEREKTKGRMWFDLPATELTDETKADLELLQMRAAVDPLAFYRRNDRCVIPKYFQIGRVVDVPEDFYSNRMTKKERKRTMLDELLCDQAFINSKKEKFKLIKEREYKKKRGAFQHSGSRRFRKKKDIAI